MSLKHSRGGQKGVEAILRKNSNTNQRAENESAAMDPSMRLYQKIQFVWVFTSETGVFFFGSFWRAVCGLSRVGFAAFYENLEEAASQHSM